MKNIIRLFIIPMLAFAFAGCEQTGPTEEPGLNQDLAFQIEIMEVNSTTAKLNVTHNGVDTDTWYGFATTELNADEATLIADKVKELMAGGKVTALKKNADLVINLNDLQAEAAYKYIAFGLTANGTIYGNTASKTFETINDPSVLRQTDKWAISYSGRQTQEDVEYDTFLVECKEGERYYFTTVMKDLLTAYEMTLEEYVESEIQYFTETILKYYKVNEVTYTESTIVGGPRMESGTYYGIAIGFDDKGAQTGEYSVAELVIPEEEATEEYNKWLGAWKISDGTRYYDLTIHAYDNNFMYAVTGWEEGAHLEVDADGDGEQDGYDISAMFDGAEFVFPTFYTKGNMDFQEYEITYFYGSEESTQPDYLLGLFGVGDMSYQGESATNSFIGLTSGVITSASTDGQTATLNGNSLDYQGIAIQYKGMGYIGYPLAENATELWLCNEPMMFPLTMTKQAAEASQMSAQEFFFKKNLDKGKYRKIQTKPVVFQAI